MLRPIPHPITYLGPEDAKHRLYVQDITHGIEMGPALACAWAIKELKPKNVRVCLVSADPQGLREEGYGFVDLEGDECVDFPWYGTDPWGGSYLRRAFDLNSEFGMSSPLSERSKEIRELLHEFQPTFVLALHETWNPFFWGGSGILLLETYPTSPADWDLLPGAVTGTEGIQAILNPLRYLEEMVADWAGGVASEPMAWLHRRTGLSLFKDKGRMYRRLQKSLANNPHYQLVSRIVKRYEDLGGYLCGYPWTKFLDGAYKNSMCGPGRINRSLWTGITSWLTLSSYCTNQFGCPSVTSETFDPIRAGTWGIEERAEQSFLFIKAVMEELGEEDNEALL